MLIVCLPYGVYMVHVVATTRPMSNSVTTSKSYKRDI